MPNIHSPDLKTMGWYGPRELKAKVDAAAAKLGISTSQFILDLLDKQTKSIKLSSDDYEEIARATLKAEKKYKRSTARGGSNKHSKARSSKEFFEIAKALRAKGK